MNLKFSWLQAKCVRQGVQLLAFALYLFLIFAALPGRAAFPLADLFFRLDPLAAAGAMLAARSWIPRLGLALLTVALTVLLGRVWCGWLCPLGSLLDWLPLRPAKKRPVTLSPRWRMVKNVLLILILAMALFGSLSLMIFDPITILTRTMTTAILPALNHAVTATERAAYAAPFLQPVIDWLEKIIRGPILPAERAAYNQNALIAAVFFGIVGLNALAHRFWCRYLCPLGGLLGLLSKISILRPVIEPAACTRCNRCARACPVDAIEGGDEYKIIPAECTLCLDCLAVCNRDGIALKSGWQPDTWRPADPSRRQLLVGLAAGAVGAAVLQTGLESKQPDFALIRPPGADSEDDFLSRCIRCGQCMKVCPTGGVQPTVFEAGVAGLWTPQLLFRLGQCDYGCNACGQVCPSGAIPWLELEEKRQTVIGLASIDHNRCLPWAYNTPCIVCEEMCPLPEKAIRVEEVTVIDSLGEEMILQRPYVLSELCIGCGTCQNQCPLSGKAAINIYRAI